MDQLNSLRERLTTNRLLTILAVVLMVGILVGFFLFFNASILPKLKTRDELAARLMAAERDIQSADPSQGGSSQLEQEVATAQARLDAAAGFFLDESEAAQALSALYQLAAENQIEIIDLQTQPVPESDEKSVFDARTFRLQAEGDVGRLIEFVSGIRGGTVGNLSIANVNLVESEGMNLLSMDLTLYTSPYAAGPSPGVTPTPQDLTQLEEALSAAWAAQDWPQAINLLNQILTLKPGDVEAEGKLYSARVNHGYRLLDEGDHQGAARQFNLALEIRPGGEEALAGLEQAQALPTPTLTAAQRLEQQLHQPWAEEDWPQVIAIIEQILEINPNDDEMMEKLYAAYVNYGYQLIEAGQLEGAKEKFIVALAINPDGLEAQEGLRQLAGEPTFPTPIPGETATPPAEPTTYVVQQGDTLYSIARRFGTTVDAIKAANGLTGNTISVGQRLTIPGGTVQTPAPGGTVHVVQQGDTLYSIARRYNTTVQAIMVANGLSNTRIVVGQQLRIPAP
jgi:LysM repeat protein